MSSEKENGLMALLERFPLPEGVGTLETFTDDASVSGVTIRLAGIATQFRSESATGSAASLSQVPLDRAYMELVERVAILQAMRSEQAEFIVRLRAGTPSSSAPRETVFPTSSDPDVWRWARSSGVAVGSTWSDAARRARLELVERDRVLRSWYGEYSPEEIVLPDGLVPSALHALYEFGAYSFGVVDDVAVAGMIGLPRRGTLVPLVLGFAARESLPLAVDAAFSESLQPLGFLSGELLPTQPPSPSPTADFHQDYFLYPGHMERLRAWLHGENSRYRGILEIPALASEPAYVDLTPLGLESKLFVARAIPAGHVPLAFGSRHPMVGPSAPEALWVHPIA